MKIKSLFKVSFSFLIFYFVVICFFPLPSAHATLFIIDDVADAWSVGDFQFFGNAVPSPSSYNLEVLTFRAPLNISSWNAFDSSVFNESPNGDISLKDIQDHLAANGITSADFLVFGVDVNEESGDFLDITGLTLQITHPDFSQTYSLRGDSVRIFEGINGSSTIPEARMRVDFGFDIMSLDANGGDYFFLKAEHSAIDGRPDTYFLSGLYSHPVPEPATAVLMGLGFFFLAAVRRRKVL